MVGLRATGEDDAQIVGERFNPRAVAAYLLDTLPNQPRHVLIEAWPMTLMPTSRVERMDIHTGKRTALAEAPLPRASFTTDAAGKVRFALGMAGDNVSKRYHRAADSNDWTLVNDEAASGIVETPVGFDAAGRVAYLRAQRAQGPDAVIAYDAIEGSRKQLLRDAALDPWTILRSAGPGREPIGVAYTGATVRTAFFDPEHPEALRQRSLEKGFGGLPVLPVSASKDARYALALSWSAHNPGDFFLFDTGNSRAERLLSRRSWIDPALSADVQPMRLEARDGLVLDGFVTRPRGNKCKMPLVVMPHGGPFGVFDRLAYDDDAQLLAAAGYAVLQLNFRGSGNRGRRFREAGALQWGARMQDDLTDATRWAIAEGIADPERICLVGGSYGAYAAMMGLAREPDLYRCGVGYVGVYDLAMMAGDRVRRGESVATWMAQWVGADDALLAAAAMLQRSRTRYCWLPVGATASRRRRTRARCTRRCSVPVPRSTRCTSPAKATASSPRTTAAPTPRACSHSCRHTPAARPLHRLRVDVCWFTGGSKPPANATVPAGNPPPGSPAHPAPAAVPLRRR